MRAKRPLLPIRSPVVPARLGCRQHSLASSPAAKAACVRFTQSNLAVALAARPVWLYGSLFYPSRLPLSSAAVRHVA